MLQEAREGHDLETHWRSSDDQEMIEEFQKVVKNATRKTLHMPKEDY